MKSAKPSQGDSTIRAMTAYASASKSSESQSVQVILRSLNFKYLDIGIHNLVAEDIWIEEAIKREIKKKIYRGKVEVFIFLAEGQEGGVRINKKVVGEYISQANSIAKKYKIKSELKISDILRLPQAISWERTKKSQPRLIVSALKKALAKLMDFKEKQGQAIRKEVLSNLNKIKENAKNIKTRTGKIAKRENGKEDIDEELSLISFYADKLGKKITGKKIEPKGKSIDFLVQEILRELNAASSKTKDKASALLIVEAKNYLERIREQAQNIE